MDSEQPSHQGTSQQAYQSASQLVYPNPSQMVCQAPVQQVYQAPARQAYQATPRQSYQATPRQAYQGTPQQVHQNPPYQEDLEEPYFTATHYVCDRGVDYSTGARYYSYQEYSCNQQGQIVWGQAHIVTRPSSDEVVEDDNEEDMPSEETQGETAQPNDSNHTNGHTSVLEEGDLTDGVDEAAYDALWHEIMETCMAEEAEE